MSSQGFVRIFVLNILKVFIKPFMKGAFSLTYILEATNFAGEATMLWLLQQTLRLEGNFLPNFLEMMCPEVSMLLQYLQSEVTQIFCYFPTLPKLGFNGRLDRTNKSRRRGLRLEPQTSLLW